MSLNQYSKFLQLSNGADRTVDLSSTSNALAVANMELLGSSSGILTQQANASTTNYTIVWPAAQAGASGDVLTNDGSGNLSWAPASGSGAITALTGDVTASGPGAAAATLATVNSNVGSFGSSTSIPSFTVNAKGLITAASGNAVVAPAGTLSGTTLNATVVSSSLTSVGTISSGTWQGTSIAPTHGGTGLSAYSTGDILYASASNVLSALSIGSSGQVLTVSGGIPSWQTATTGTVTSVALSDGSTSPIYSISGSPVTSSGTLTFTLNSQSANTVFAGPSSGSSAQPSFRALVSADIPSLSSIYLPLAGGTMSGAINMGSHQINNLASPSVSTDAATKGYVDAAISGLTWQGPAKAYASSNVPLTGGATLTIDGYSVQNGDLVLLGNQTTASQNGEYSASGIGTAYVLTANGLPTAVGDAWLVTKGTVYANSAFVATAVVPAAAFIEFAGPTAYVFNAPLSLSGNTVSITQAGSSSNGYLSSTDWNTFNNKQAAGNYITALTGDATASGPGSAALTLATVNSNIGTFASVTVNAKGLVTAAAALSGDASTSGSTLTLATVNSNVGTYTNATITVNAKGLITAASSGSTSATSISSIEVSAQALSASTLYALRYEMASDSGTPGQMYKADNDTTSNDNFYVIGLAYPGSSVSIGGNVTVVEFGLINVPSHGFTVGAPLYLGSSGALTSTAPSASLTAVVRVGMVKDANNIFVDTATIGVN
jgi:hypothetical protein